jgi:hypothetical protein
MKAPSKTAAIPTLLRTLALPTIVFLGRRNAVGAAEANTTVTYRHNATGLNVLHLECPQNGTKLNGTDYSRPMCRVETALTEQCLWTVTTLAYNPLEGPYFRASADDDFMDIYNCGGENIFDDDDNSTNTAAQRTSSTQGLATVTCDAACTCETGSYPGLTDETGEVLGYTTTFEPDGGLCEVISTQPGRVGPSTPPGPPIYISGASLGPAEHLHIVCDGKENEEQMLGGCQIHSGSFGGFTSLQSSELWEFKYFSCVESDCVLVCPYICNNCTVVSEDGSTTRECEASTTDPSSDASSSRISMWQLLLAFGLVASTGTGAILA